MAITVTGRRDKFASIWRAAATCWFGAPSDGIEAAPLALNNEYINAPNAANTAYVGLIKANSSDVPQVGNSAVIATVANGSTAIVNCGGTQTLTNKTLTAPTITAPTITGATSIGAGATLTTPTITGAIYSDIKSTTAAVTANATTTYADVTGLSVTVVPGTYKFRCVLPSTVANGTGGIKYCFKLTTTVLTSIEATGIGFTASAVAVQHTTTTTDQTDLFTQAAVVLMTLIEGSCVVGTGGTIKVQVAQNTSNASNTVALVGGTMQFDRIA